MKYGIIAAGEGSRLAREGVAVPKPLVVLDGRPMIRRLIDIMASCNAESISIIVNSEMTQVAQYITEVAMKEVDVPINLTIKSTPDSMHSFYEVSRSLGDGKFVLTTVDTIFDPAEFARYVEAFENDRHADGYMAVTTHIDDEKPLYIATDPAEDRITAFCDKPFEGVKFISGGIYGLSAPRATDVLADCIERGVARMRNYQRALVEAGLNLRPYPFGTIIDVDHAGDVDKACDLIRSFEK